MQQRRCFYFRLLEPASFGTIWSWIFFGFFATNSAVLVTGRYLKEDIFLLFGMTVLALALTYERSEPRQSRIAPWIGGLGCAVVLSSKYIGLVFVAVFLVAYCYHRGRERWADLRQAGMAVRARHAHHKLQVGFWFW